jgi:hypothetical protein
LLSKWVAATIREKRDEEQNRRIESPQPRQSRRGRQWLLLHSPQYSPQLLLSLLVLSFNQRTI